MRVIIAGGRDIFDMEAVATAIAEAGFKITEVVCGLARGVDTLGSEWAMNHGIPVTNFAADWQKFGKRAGTVRNALMGNYAEALIAVWDGKSRGTKHMIDYARMKNLKVHVHPYGVQPSGPVQTPLPGVA